MELDLATATATATPAATAAAASLAPGFRFHPTDEELVRYYLKRKVCGKPFRFDAISEIDIYKTEPWDLPGKSRLKSRDLEWYFFSVLDKKYGNGSKTNRATEKGYWKTTGKDRPVYNRSKTVGMKKTLVFHSGRAPRGQRTNWVMHEYRLVDEDLGKAGFAQDAFVLCRVFQKSGTGPKNGEQYGAPFVEEEWEEDQLVMVPGQVAADEVAVDDAFLDGDDLQQILEASIPSEEVPLPLSFYYDDNGTYVPETNFVEDDQKVLVDTATSYCVPEQPDDNNLFNLPVQYDADTKPVKHEYNTGEASNSLTSGDEDYLVEEPFLDASDNILFDDGAFLETNDLSHPVQADPSCFDMLDEYLTFFNADEDNLDSLMPYDSSMMAESENLLPNQQFLGQKDVNMEAREETGGSQPLLPGNSSDAASTSKKKSGNFGSDIHYPFLEKANRMLGSIPAPPAFASEFPSKEAALRFNSPSPVRVTAGMIQIRNMTMGGNETSWALGKHLDINIILSFGMPQNSSPASPVSPGSMSKASSAVSRGFFYLLFGWFLILSMSFKIGSFIYTGKAS